MGFCYDITTKFPCITISIFYGRCKEEQLFGFQAYFKYLPLLELKPFLDLFLYIYISGNYMEDFYYSNHLFHLTILLTVFSVLTGHRNGKCYNASIDYLMAKQRLCLKSSLIDMDDK